MKWLNFFKNSSLHIALVFGTLGFISAQERPDTTKNLYCIGVKQSFTSSGDCSSNPDFENAEISVLFEGGKSIRKTIYSDSLNTILVFPGNFYVNDTNLHFRGTNLWDSSNPPLARTSTSVLTKAKRK